MIKFRNFITYAKSIDNDVTYQKIFIISKILAIFIFLNMANLLLILSVWKDALYYYPDNRLDKNELN